MREWVSCVYGVRSRSRGLGFKVQGLGFRVKVLEFRIWGSGVRVPRFQGSRLRRVQWGLGSGAKEHRVTMIDAGKACSHR